MPFREQPPNSSEPSILVSAVFEPRNGHTCDEVMARLRELGAEDIEVLAEDHISARVARVTLSQMGQLAYVTEKPRHQFR